MLTHEKKYEKGTTFDTADLLQIFGIVASSYPPVIAPNSKT